MTFDLLIKMIQKDPENETEVYWFRKWLRKAKENMSGWNAKSAATGTTGQISACWKVRQNWNLKNSASANENERFIKSVVNNKTCIGKR